ncbi:MAG: hypothetical protein Q4G21_09575 [Dermabacter sp.]|nr:hypothetical protein [Dermabacter sp.]
MNRRTATTLAIVLLLALPACTTTSEAKNDQSPVAGATAPGGASPVPATAPPGNGETDTEDPHEGQADIDAAQRAIEATMAVWLAGPTMTQMDFVEAIQPTLAPEAQDISRLTWAHKIKDSAVTDIRVEHAEPSSVTFIVETDWLGFRMTALKQPDGSWLTGEMDYLSEDGN